MTTETILPELVGTLAELPEHIQKVIKAYGGACYRTALQSPEIQALRKDAERIEWLEAQTKKSYTGISFDYNHHVEDGYVVDHGYRFIGRYLSSGRMDSLRKAIDAAMEKNNESGL